MSSTARCTPSHKGLIGSVAEPQPQGPSPGPDSGHAAFSHHPPKGCAFRPRCDRALQPCEQPPEMVRLDERDGSFAVQP